MIQNADLHLFQTRRMTWSVRLNFNWEGKEMRIYTPERSDHRVALEEAGEVLALGPDWDGWPKDAP